MAGHIRHVRERQFASLLESQGKLFFYEPKSFKLPLPHSSYRPDFYVVDDNTFYGVCILDTRIAEYYTTKYGQILTVFEGCHNQLGYTYRCAYVYC